MQMQSRTSVSSQVLFSRDYLHIRDQFAEIVSNGEPRKMTRIPGKVVARRSGRHGPTVEGHPTTQIAGAELSRLSDDPNALVVLTYTKLCTPVVIAASSRTSVPVTFVSMKS
jgi:hypothetical protein